MTPAIRNLFGEVYILKVRSIVSGHINLKTHQAGTAVTMASSNQPQSLQEASINTIPNPRKPNAFSAMMSKPSKSTTSSSLKRSHDQVRPAVAEDPAYYGRALADIDDDDPENHSYKPDLNCNKVRTKIQQLIDSGEVKVTHFQRDLGISSNSYGRFMKLKGPWNGIDNQTYHAAYHFFRKREAAGIKTGAKKRKSNDGKAVGTGTKAAVEPAVLDVEDVHLDKEEDEKVEVYDTPAEIRKKISAHMPKEGVTAAGFCRTLSKQLYPPRPIQTAQMQRFRKYSGPVQGNTSVVYYAAYVYFEKLRVKEGKAPSKHRLEMERIWGHEGGFDTKHNMNRGYVGCETVVW